LVADDFDFVGALGLLCVPRRDQSVLPIHQKCLLE
jgi:hypothetical protein